MSVILFILGILLTGAGIVTIGFGIPINEFNLGNTMILAGTTAAAAGLILIGLAAAVDQLTQIAKALRPRAGARPTTQPQAVEQPFPSPVRPGPFSAQAPIQASGPATPPTPPMPAPSRAPVFAKQRVEERASEPAPVEPASEASFSAIERLRSSLARADRKAVDIADAEVAPYAPDAPARAAPAAADARANPPDNGAAPVETSKKPPLDFLFRSKAREPQPEPFDAVWPKRGARRSDEQAAAEGPIDRPSLSDTPSASAPDESRPPAILKSGVVDGMAYTLYADGSIEAQLPQGTVRFGSIAELRSHIENNS
jgi:hypothetical protein